LLVVFADDEVLDEGRIALSDSVDGLLVAVPALVALDRVAVILAGRSWKGGWPLGRLGCLSDWLACGRQGNWIGTNRLGGI
jgi:hypothetical protein